LLVLGVLLLLSLFIHIRGGFRFLKPLLVAAVFLLTLFVWIKDFSLEKLPLNLFFTAYAFSVFLLLKDKNFRNYFYISLLSFLALAIVGINFQSVVYGFLIFFYLFNLVYFFLLLAVKGFELDEPKVLKNLFKYALLVFVFVVTFGSVLFFILPRPEKPLVALIKKEIPKPAVGFSNEVKLGSFSQIAEDKTVVFRAKISVKTPDLYWRGNTLELFDGNRWRSISLNYAKVIGYQSEEIRETLLLTPYGGRNIFTYGFPVRVLDSNGEIFINETKGVAEARKPVVKPLKVELLAVEPRGVGVKLLNERPLLYVPPRLKPLLERIVKEHHLRGLSFGLLLKRLGEYFSSFRYSLNNRARDLEEFLTVYREGNCEYFASAAALILRYLGYPTRVVVGFFGGDFNPLTGYYVVRQKDAHAWTEIYFNHRWFRFDATKYAQTSREVENTDKNLLEKNRLQLFWDTLNTLWLEYVINLDRQKQSQLLNTVKNLFLHISLLSVIKLVFLLSLLLFLGYLLLKPSVLLVVYYRLKYRISIPLSLSPIGIYLYLWEHYPAIWKREKDGLLKALIYLSNIRYKRVKKT